MIGTRILHYEIRKKLGKGAMGVVYLAFDTQLGRQVALKVLAGDRVADQDSRRRFLHEARAQAMLNHPNITTFYDVGEHGETAFIVMEYVEGRPLSEYLRDHDCRPLEVVKLAQQIAAGLSAAHQHGVIHRDIKPENLMVMPDGHVKIMDFGLARWKGASTLTQKGTRIGSPCYMAPEQAEGAKVDHRADIFASGIVLYELLCRRRPFDGENEAVVLYELINSLPHPPARYCREVPEELERIVLKCLAKDPDARYQSAADLGADLRSLEHDMESGRSSTSFHGAYRHRRRASRRVLLVLSAVVLLAAAALAVVEPLRTGLARALGIDAYGSEQFVVVLPFTLLDDQSKGPAFAAGLLETITSMLTQMETAKPSIRVIPASEVRRTGVTSAHDARLAFGATHTVTGSLQNLGNVVRATVNLVDATSEVQLSSAVIDREPASISGLQDSIAYALGTMLSIELDSGTRARLSAKAMPDPGAYEAYMKGLGYLQLYAEQLGGLILQNAFKLDSAIAQFTSALNQEPGYAAGHEGLGTAYWRKYRLSGEAPLLDSALEHALRSVELAPGRAGAYAALARIHQDIGRYQEALFEFRHAVTLDSGLTRSYLGLAEAYTALDRIPEAETTYRHLIAQRPDYLPAFSGLGQFYADHGRRDDAHALLKEVAAMPIRGWDNWNRVGAMYFALGDRTNAEACWTKSLQITPNYPAYSNLATVHFYNGDYELAARDYEASLALDDRDYRLWFNLAAVYEQIPERASSVEPAYRHTIEMAEAERAVNPRQPVLMAHLAECYKAVEDTASAMALAHDALKLAPDNLDVVIRSGLVYEHLGHRDLALDLIGRGLHLGFPRSQLEALPELASLLSDPRLDDAPAKPPEREGGTD